MFSGRWVSGQWVVGRSVGELVGRWSALGRWRTCRWVGERLLVAGGLSVVGGFVIHLEIVVKI